MFLTTGWDWGIFQGSCAGYFPLIFSQNTKPGEFVCPGMDGAVGQVRKSSNPQEKLFPGFCWLLGGIFWVFFLVSFLFSMPGEGSYLSACHTSGWQHNLSWKSQNSPSTAALAEGILLGIVGFMENPQDTNHLYLIPIKCPQNPASGNDQGWNSTPHILGKPKLKPNRRDFTAEPIKIST